LLTGAAATAAAPRRALSAPAKAMTLEIPTRSGASWPLWLAETGGYYQKHDIDPKIVFGVHPVGIAMLLSGEAQMTNYGLEQVLAAAARDPSLVMMGSSLNRGNFGLMARPEITSVAQLKGKRIGVGRVGDVPYFYTIDLLAKYGIGPRDVQWISVPADSAARAAVLVSGQADASLLTAPSYFKLQTMGLKLIDSLTNHEDILISTAYVFTRKWVAANRDWPRRIIMAQAEAIKRFYGDKAFAVEVYRKNDPQSQEDVERLYDIFVKSQILERVPLLSRTAVTAAAARLVPDIPTIKTMDFSPSVTELFGPGVKAEQDAKLATAFG